MGTRKSHTEVYLFMELAESDFRRLAKTPTFLDEKQIQVLMYRLMVVLNYLHSGGIVHRDIKPGNILVNSDCSIKLCDFSISRSTAGLVSSGLDVDKAIRQDPYLSSSFGSYSEMASMSIPSLSGAIGDDEDDGEADENDVDEGSTAAHKTVHCGFQVNHTKPIDVAPTTEEDKENDMEAMKAIMNNEEKKNCLLYTSPSPRDLSTSRMPSSA
eukprot:TRINITY_DN1757_c0_g1_i1.p2 TRINITY_DN1757_c0_g1~~TRINITY_DN1757_c0_g1_i1.p2  ORF type:complete len:213 (+),score=35.76 TRINITY_DN1757_c0_g1_i1:169-807(+)